MSLSRLAALACCIASIATPLTLPAANEYFWPDYRDNVEFKVKSHAFRGTLKLSLGSKVKIGDKTYQELIVEAKPNRLPGQIQEVYLRADEQGLYSRYSKSPEDKEIRDLALPVEVGKSWQTFDSYGNPSERAIEGIDDCEIRGARFERCVSVSFESPKGAAAALFAPEFGEIVNSRFNGFNRRSILKK